MNVRVNPLSLSDMSWFIFRADRDMEPTALRPSKGRGGELTHDASTHPVTHPGTDFLQARLINSVIGRD